MSIKVVWLYGRCMVVDQLSGCTMVNVLGRDQEKWIVSIKAPGVR